MTLLPPNRLLMSITGPSGSGKDSIIAELHKRDPNIRQYVTATTRKPRNMEEDGVHYFFLTEEEFDRRLREGDFLEHNAAYHGHKYGTLLEVVQDLMEEGYDVISTINWTGVAQYEEKVPDNLVSFAVLPPSLEELENRLTKRAKQSKESPEARQKRMEKIRDDIAHMEDHSFVMSNPDMENSCLNDYDYVIVNDVLEDAVDQVYSIIQQEREKRSI